MRLDMVSNVIRVKSLTPFAPLIAVSCIHLVYLPNLVEGFSPSLSASLDKRLKSHIPTSPSRHSQWEHIQYARRSVSKPYSFSLKSSESSEDVAEPVDQLTDIWNGWEAVVSQKSLDATKLSAYWKSLPDVVATLSMVPLSIEAFRTALTGAFDENSYSICAIATLLCGISHLQLTLSRPRDFRAPRLAEPRTVYEFSYLYLFAFSWILWRINLGSFPTELEALDVVGTIGIFAVTLYGVLYPLYALSLFDKPREESGLQPSSSEYQEQAKLLCTGNIAINVLACLFLPFVATLCVGPGSEWWDRVQGLHEHQAAFLGVSFLVAILGDVYGTALLRVKELGIVTQYNSIVALGIVGNVVLLLVPEIVFNGIYSSGVSEIGFYFE